MISYCPAWLLINKKSKFFIIINDNILFFKYIDIFLLQNKNLFITNNKVFMKILKNICLEYVFLKGKNNLLICLIFEIINKINKNITLNGVLNAYWNTQILLKSILQNNFFYSAYLEIPIEPSKELLEMAFNLLEEDKFFPFQIVYQKNENLMCGFRLYYKKIRIDVSYQRIINDILKSI
jgi:hypothetical protein